MSGSEYLTYTDLVRGALARASEVNQRFRQVETGLAKLPGSDAIKNGLANFYTAGGSANVLTVAMTPTRTSYVAGLQVALGITATNTNAATLNVDGLGAVAIKRSDGTALVAGDLVNGQVMSVVYDGSVFRLQRSGAAEMAGYVSSASTYASAALASKNAAATSETNAHTSEVNAAASAAAAAASAGAVSGSGLVHTTGNESIGGLKTFSSTITASGGIAINGQTLSGLTATGKAIAEAADAAAVRTAIGSVIGTNVQAQNTLLSAYSTAAWSAGVQLAALTAANTITLKTVGSAAGNILDKTAGDALYIGVAGGTLTGALTLAADPTAALHAATKQYVDAVAAGMDPKPSVKCATTANITLSGAQTIDGISAVLNDRVLVWLQTNATQNGIYLVQASTWIRVTDMDSWSEVPGAFCFVEQGTLYGDCGFVCTSDAGGTVGSNSISFSQFYGPGTYTASGGITRTGVDFALSNMAQATVKGRASGAGTGAPTDLSQAQLTALITASTTSEMRAAASTTGFVQPAAIANACAVVTLTDAATISVDWASFISADVTLSGNRTLGNPTNVQPGTSRTIMVKGNDATNRTLSFGTNYKGTLPQITTATSTKYYLVSLYAYSSTHIVATSIQAL